MSIFKPFDTSETVPALIHGKHLTLPVRRAKLSQLLELRDQLVNDLKLEHSLWKKLTGTYSIPRQFQLEQELREVNDALNTIVVEWTCSDLT